MATTIWGGTRKRRNEGAAFFSHAWVEAYVPLIGWIGLDPTNNEKTNWRYIKIGHGRNYSDVVPVKGMYRGTPCQQLEVTVELKRV
ncbi:hypothetical protein GCM10020331_043980 [Ectobacillus funiculus]